MNVILNTIRSELCAMFKRPESRRWNYQEEYALAQVAMSDDCLNEWQAIKSFRERMPANERRFHANSIESVLTNWNKLLDRAAVYEVPKSPEELKRLQNMREMIR